MTTIRYSGAAAVPRLLCACCRLWTAPSPPPCAALRPRRACSCGVRVMNARTLAQCLQSAVQFSVFVGLPVRCVHAADGGCAIARLISNIQPLIISHARPWYHRRKELQPYVGCRFYCQFLCCHRKYHHLFYI